MKHLALVHYAPPTALYTTRPGAGSETFAVLCGNASGLRENSCIVHGSGRLDLPSIDSSGRR
ncbi:MAG TPA: hypothetical protein VGF67_29975, partial [Ktedonobacteraceae bacterium]